MGPRRPPKGDRRALHGALIFGGLILICFLFAALLMRGDRLEGDAKGPRIGVVEISGPIVGSKQAVQDLRRFRKNERIKAVVVRINSPGGAVGPSQEIYREITRVREDKPVVASMETVAASGGYYIAAAAQKIVANPGTITGSIGVITQTTNVEELVKLAHVETETFKTGKFKDTLSPLRGVTDEERAYLNRLLHLILDRFVADVAKGRKLPVDKVKQLADGRVFAGSEAKALKLVDELGNLSDALELAAKLAQAEGDPVPVYPRRDRGLLRQLLEGGSAEARELLRQALQPSQRIETRDPRF